MHFLIDNKKNLIFGWSAKCGCSHIKKIYWFFQNGQIDNPIHINVEEFKELPLNIEDYHIIIISRNPYKRIVSGFLDKYSPYGMFRHLWNDEKITFIDFVNELIIRNWEKIDVHHFIPQTEEKFNINILNKSKNLKIFDIENIDYNYIENLFDEKIPDELITYKGEHIRKIYDESFDKKVYNLELNEYFNFNIKLENFYNDEIKEKIYNFYKNDFLFFNKHNINYDLILN